jgi:hypothetical protein
VGDVGRAGSVEPRDAGSADSSKPTSADREIINEALEGAIPLTGLDPHDHKALVGVDHWQDIQLKKTYAKWLLILVAFQLLVTDTAFIAYAWVGMGWELEASVIQVWLGSTLVELIGVALVITRYLFPRRDRSPDGP